MESFIGTLSKQERADVFKNICTTLKDKKRTVFSQKQSSRTSQYSFYDDLLSNLDRQIRVAEEIREYYKKEAENSVEEENEDTQEASTSDETEEEEEELSGNGEENGEDNSEEE